MKKYFYIITIELVFRPIGEKTLDSRKFSCKGSIEIEAKEDKPSLIYEKIHKNVMVKWKNFTITRETIVFFNFWEEKEISEDLPMDLESLQKTKAGEFLKLK